MQSEKDKIMELLTITEVKEGGEVIFTDRSIEILQELGQQYKETPLFKKSRQDNPDWEGDANAGLLFVYMCERLTEAPSRIHTMIVPANMTLLTANLEVIKNEEIDQVTILSKELEKVKDVFDYCIIDCPPDINISVINALVAADEVIIPIKIDGYAFDGMKELEEQINNAKQLNPKLKFRGCLVTMFYNRDVCRQGEEYLQNQRYPVFRTHIRRTEKADEVTFTTQSLMQYSPRSGAARDYKTFVKEYLEG